MNIIIPACGLGERFKKNGYTTYKPLIKIFNKEMIYYVIDNIKTQKDDSIFIIINFIDVSFEKTINEKYNNVKLININNNTRGAAETLYLGIEIIKNITNNKSCFVMDCDTFYTEDVLELYRCNNYNNSIFYTKNYDKNPIYSYIVFNNERVIDIAEKKKISDNANTGIYCFNDINKLSFYCNKIINKNKMFNNEFYTSCVISEMILDNEIFTPVYLDSNYLFNLGTPEQLTNYINNTYLFSFDLDGTLVLTDNIYYEVWKNILNNYNVILTPEIFSRFIIGNSDNNVISNLITKNFDENFIKSISNQKDELFIKNINEVKIIKDADNFIKEIKKNGHLISIVTNCNRNVAEKILIYLELGKYIDLLVIGNECKSSKPSSEPYIYALNYFNIFQRFMVPDKLL